MPALHLAHKNKFDRIMEDICFSRGSCLTVKFIFKASLVSRSKK